MGKVILFFASTLGFIFGGLPRSVQIFWGNSIGFILWIFRFRYSVVCQNVEIAFPQDRVLQKKIARASYSHLGNLILEVFLVLGPMKNFVYKYVDLAGVEHLQEAKRKGRGVILLSSHLGNWEVMAAAGGLLAHLDLMLVTKRLKPHWLHEAIEKGRKKWGVSAAYEPKTLRQVLAHLKNNGTVGFVLDQYAGPPVGVRVPFFGIPVGTTLAVAALVKRTGATLLVAENYRKPDGRWAAVVYPPLEWLSVDQSKESHADLAVNTAYYSQTLEKSIRVHPEQWLWTHRRFKGDLSPLKKDEWAEPRIRR